MLSKELKWPNTA